MGKFASRSAWAALGLVAVLVGNPHVAASQDVVSLGVVYPTSGPNADNIKRDVITPLNLAVKQANEKGGVLGRQIKLTVEDPHGDPATAASALRKLIDVDKILVTISGFTPLVFAQIPIAEENKVIIVSPGVSHPDLTKSEWVVRMALTADRQGKKTAQIATALGVKTTAYIGEETEAGRLFQNAFTSEFAKGGGKVVATETFKNDDNDMRGQLTKLKSYDADAIYVITSMGRPQALVLKQMAEVGYKPKHVFTNFIMESYEVQALAPELTEGAIWPTLAIDPAFAQSYKADTGADPTSSAGMVYGSMELVLAAIAKAGTLDTTKIRDTIYNYGPFKSPVGTFTFTGTGEPDVDLTVKTMKAGKIVDYTP